MDYTRARDELKPRLIDYVTRITSKSTGQGMYTCPLCGSGTGRKHTGAFSIDRKDPTRWKCFSCGKGGDIFDLIGMVENIPEPLEQLKRAGELFGIDITGGEAVGHNQPKNERYTDMSIHTDTYTQADTAKENLETYFRECHSHLKETSYHTQRGISEKTASRFMLGYDSHYTKSTGGAVWKALIIPTGPNSYVARNTDPKADGGNRYRKAGSATPLNIEALETAVKPIFIVEGEIDALSIIEACGEAVGLGSTANIDKFINHVKNHKPAQPLILALDNDKAGQEATKKLEKALDGLGVFYCNLKQDIFLGEKDANEALLKYPNEYMEALGYFEYLAERMKKEALEAEREEYLKNSAYSHIKDFVEGITAVNTPPQPTGFHKLDSILEGGLYEGLYIIGAITSLGKTTMALQIADQIAEQGRDVLIFSLEMARSELMSKSISRLTLLDVFEDPKGDVKNAKTDRGITVYSRYNKYSQEEIDLIKRSIKAYGQYARHIFIHEGIGDIGADYVRETIGKHIRITGQAPVVVVDYMQILAPYDVRATDKQNTDKAVLELKRISRDYKIPVLAVSSFNRTNYNEAVKLEAFKESGAIEYGSDVLIGLQLKGAGTSNFESDKAMEKNPREIELVVLKNRHGEARKKIDYKYYTLFNYLQEVDTEPKAERKKY